MGGTRETIMVIKVVDVQGVEVEVGTGIWILMYSEGKASRIC